MNVKKQDICTVLGCLGVVGTAIVATRAGKKEQASGGKSWKHHILTGLVVAATGGVIIAGNVFSHLEFAGLVGSAAYLVANRKKLEGKLREAVGDDAVDKVKKDISGQFAENTLLHHQTIEETGHGELLCIEGYSGRIFRSSKESVDRAILQFNEYYKDNYCCCLNDFYEFLGIETTHFGHQYGWVNSEDWAPEGGLSITATYLTVDEQKDPAPYHEDMYIIDFDYLSYPMECWQEY